MSQSKPLKKALATDSSLCTLDAGANTMTLRPPLNVQVVQKPDLKPDQKLVQNPQGSLSHRSPASRHLLPNKVKLDLSAWKLVTEGTADSAYDPCNSSIFSQDPVFQEFVGAAGYQLNVHKDAPRDVTLRYRSDPACPDRDIGFDVTKLPYGEELSDPYEYFTWGQNASLAELEERLKTMPKNVITERERILRAFREEFDSSGDGELLKKIRSAEASLEEAKSRQAALEAQYNILMRKFHPSRVEPQAM